MNRHQPRLTAIDFFKYIGPGFLVTIGFIDPGNWAANLAAGSLFGYKLLWVVSLSTIFLIVLQHNAAHLGISTGLCLAEAATAHLRPWLSKAVLGSAVAAAVSTALAEILGAAIALNMLFRLPLKIGMLLALGFVIWMLFANTYRKLEKWIIGFVSLIGLAFIIELTFVRIDWPAALTSSFIPAFPDRSIVIVMSVLGAVVMPHNLFLHSEVIQSRQWNLQDEAVRIRQLKYEFADTIFSMGVGWAINSAIIIMAAATFFSSGIQVSDLAQASDMLKPLLGQAAALIFAVALLFSGLSAAVTAGMAGGSIFAGISGEPYDIKDSHTRWGVLLTLGCAGLLIVFIGNAFQALILSQILLSVQLPVTILLQIYLTSSAKVMGRFRNSTTDKILLWLIGASVILLNVLLLRGLLRP
jgi:manganese transport protein